ncbi:MAG: type III-B CRISPR module RAMP protein Cmr4 [Clostridia bacterium]|nr:MAG: type III-B CRISPR module RAMP protein Cmr4 [Clostridia bacterium]
MRKPQSYLALCLDPVHVGTGGYRLGRVDMSIVREPATGIPKIPGTSMAGAVRAYAELAKEEDADLPEIDTVFGNTKAQGMLRFYDVEIVLFPVSSGLGTIWVSTAERLETWLMNGHDSEGDLVLPKEPPLENKVVAVKGITGEKVIQMGWLLVESEDISQPGVKISLPKSLAFVKRLVMVSDKLFYHLVNDHLEVRTSVKINDATGAAETGGLFTYEAIPRGTILGFEVAIDSRRGNGGVNENKLEKLLEKAFAGLKVLGIGGMGTRGFGRIEILKTGAVDGGEQG